MNKSTFLVGLTLFLFCNTLCSQKTAIAVSKQRLETTKYDPVAIYIKEHFENVLLDHELVTVVDRDIFELTEKEREVQKRESFMDGSYVKQDQAVGASLIIDLNVDPEKETLVVNILDVEEGTMLNTEKYKIGRFLTEDLEIERPKYFGRFIEEKAEELLETLDLAARVKVELVEISQTKGDKAKELVFYCKEGCKLSRKTKLKIYFEESNNDSKYYAKKRVDIGSAELTHIETDFVFIATVKSGHKDILKTFNSKTKLYAVKDN